MPTPEPLLFSDLPIAEEEQDIDTEVESEPESLLDLGGGFQVPQGLPRSQQKHFTLRELMILLDTPNGIDLNPEYQRDFVWNEERQTGLIDSLFRGQHIQGIIFNRRSDTVLGIRTEVLVCIDGKQRLTSVQRFTQGHIPCFDGHGKKWWFKQLEGSAKGRKYLPQEVKNHFWKKKLLCDTYVGMTDDQEHDTFERVQRGNPLTPAEKSQAKKGDWQQLARTFQADFPLVMGCKQTGFS